MTADWRVRGIVRRTLPVLLALTAVELVGGVALGGFEATLFRYPTLLVLVPVTIGTAGNLGSVLAARLSTVFHLGTLRFAPTDDRLVGNALAVFGLSVTVFPAVGVGGWLVTALAGEPRLPVLTVVTVATASGVVLGGVAVAVASVTTYLAYRAGLDPDEYVVPVVTNVCDVLGVVVLFAVVRVVVS
jgi:Permease, similar to cation transporters